MRFRIVALSWVMIRIFMRLLHNRFMWQVMLIVMTFMRLVMLNKGIVMWLMHRWLIVLNLVMIMRMSIIDAFMLMIMRVGILMVSIMSMAFLILMVVMAILPIRIEATRRFSSAGRNMHMIVFVVHLMVVLVINLVVSLMMVQI